jgi:dolichyl-phosphate beta-glucosyltransferase
MTDFINLKLSVVIPAYNEEKRIGQSLEQVVEFLSRQKYSSEIIVADDGSSDKTIETCEKVLKNFPHKLVRNPTNHGKGYVVRQGMMMSEGEYVLFTDADLSTPINEITRFMQFHSDGYDVVIGSRALKDSKIEIRQNWMREAMGKIFNFFARMISFKGIHDSQCGFKCFTKKAAKDLFASQKLEGFSFDVEILYLAQKKGYKIMEAPVLWRNSFQSRVQILSDPLEMFIDLLRIRWLHRTRR